MIFKNYSWFNRRSFDLSKPNETNRILNPVSFNNPVSVLRKLQNSNSLKNLRVKLEVSSFWYRLSALHSFLNERTGLLIAALKDCHAIVINATPRAIIPASMNINGPMVIR